MTTTPTSGAADLRTAAQAVVDRWDTPLWKDVPATAEYIGRLRAALAAGQATAAPAQPAAEPAKPIGYLNPKVLGPDGKIDAPGALTYSSRPCGGWTFPIYAAAPAQPAAQQGVAYAALPEPYWSAHDDADPCYPDMFSEHQMRAFADATHTLRASHGQAPAAPKGDIDE